MRRPAERSRIERFLTELGRRMRRPLRFYLVGGAAVVDMGLRQATIGTAFVVDADDPAALDEFEELVPRLKNELDVNLEPASPADFLPVPPGALDRSPYVRTYGKVAIHYYDLAATAIAKLARGAERDLADVEVLLRRGLVSWDDIDALWERMRESRRGWLRHDRAEVERRIAAARTRFE
ncbi:MAG TPA: DUF6036 family nucleotidyltransferase [Chloroflexota bacterium]|nr:DUF6036 family nucleotidyltransferase [Chloroflexota bacterium]